MRAALIEIVPKFLAMCNDVLADVRQGMMHCRLFFPTAPDYILTAHYRVQGASPSHLSCLFREVVRLTCWTWLNLCLLKAARSFCLNSRFVGPRFGVQNFGELEDSVLELGVIGKFNIFCRNVVLRTRLLGVATCTAWHSTSIMISNKTGGQYSCNVFSLPSNRWCHSHARIWLLYVRAALVAITVLVKHWFEPNV